MSDLYSWVYCSEGEIPASAVVGGEDSGTTLYVGRASMFGDIIPGKIIPEHKVCFISWGGEEHQNGEYEALVLAENAAVDWMAASKGEIPEGAVEAGVTESGEKLYVGRASHGETITCGKIHPGHSCLYIPYGGAEHSYEDYEVLVCKPQ